MVSELLSSFTLWGGLSVLFSGWVMGYSYHVEMQRHGPHHLGRPPRHQTPALSIVRKPN